ncbi:hypothetical protein COO60DRAFT_573219 [Scenedesmus sp. NREL 46B-D3]|nr:hypothetical protein COO60DRAFT_573219 [Scenedesmus sp. NREL 46B-D3]
MMTGSCTFCATSNGCCTAFAAQRVSCPLKPSRLLLLLLLLRCLHADQGAAAAGRRPSEGLPGCEDLGGSAADRQRPAAAALLASAGATAKTPSSADRCNPTRCHRAWRAAWCAAQQPWYWLAAPHMDVAQQQLPCSCGCCVAVWSTLVGGGCGMHGRLSTSHRV